ncbi:MAG: hypothetical protein EBX40_01645 [Gammaproteobacteria bacterium]|nr:hypothetical protein [Gammaproteobacteria bacterium]
MLHYVARCLITICTGGKVPLKEMTKMNKLVAFIKKRKEVGVHMDAIENELMDMGFDSYEIREAFKEFKSISK